MAKLVDLDGLKYFYSKIKAMLALKADDSAVVKSVNGVAPDTSGNVSVAVSGGGGVSTDTANTWTAAQTFNMLNVNVLGIACEAIEDKATITPTTSMTLARPTPELEDSNNVITLDLSNLAAQATFTNAKQFECIILNVTDKEYTINIKGINGALTLCSPSDIAINKGYGNCIFGKIYRFVDDAGNADGALIAFINAQKITDTL